jgi:hypothetical protein
MTNRAEGETMAEMWDDLRAKTIPRDASAIQIAEMRNAFYAGAFYLFNWFMEQMGEGPEEATDADMDKLSAIEAEIAAYFKKGTAP